VPGTWTRPHVDANPPLNVSFGLQPLAVKKDSPALRLSNPGPKAALGVVWGMSDTGAIDAASKRLGLALDALGAAVDRRREAARAEADLADQLHAIAGDRSKLAAELDQAAARGKALEVANREVARRLDVAIETIRDVLEANDR
jgi:hypothetical protein